MPTLNNTQLLLILMAILSFASGATAQLTDVFGAGTAHLIVSVATLLNGVLSSVMVALTGQSSQVKAQANQTLAQLAVDQGQPKIEVTPAALGAVRATAAG